MTDLLRLLADINRLTLTLNPGAYRSRVEEWLRGGLPGASIPQGSPSAERPLPHLDRDDFDAMALLTTYGWLLREAHQRLERVRLLETGVLPERHLTPAELRDLHRRMSEAADILIAPQGLNCINPNCDRRVLGGKDDRMIDRRCRRCYRYLAKHDVERPADLCVQDIERAREAS